MSQHFMRLVRRAEELNLLCTELDLSGRHRLLDMSDLAGTDDGCCQSRLMQQPGVGDSGITFAALGSKFAEAVHHSEVFFPIVKLLREVVGLGTCRSTGRDIVRCAVAG